ncbi:MAG: PBP1A family penicillin-binding protein [Minisyncoccia bacterium]
MKNLALFTVSLFVLGAGLIIVFIFSLDLPDSHSFADRKVVNSTQIYDRTGEVLLYDIHEDIKRTYISFDQMSLNIKNATVAIEDAEFYNHSGVRVTSTFRAVLSNFFNIGIGGGGSTITQQLVKNTLLTQKRSYVRKMKEWVLAVKIDSSMSKEKILEFYLNEVPYGGTIYGIEAASKTYFNKKALDLTLAEAAYLASIPQAPSVLSPYGKNKEKLESRKNLVLYRMRELNFITKEEYDKAKNELVAFVPQADSGIKAPHFVFFIKDYLEEKYGAQMIEYGGLKVITTIDAGLQAKAEGFVKEGALQNAKDWNGENAALVAIDPKTGQILTMVGSRDYFDKEIDGNFNVATAKRQPGSSFKPFIYATAFNKGFTQDTVLFDLPTEFQTTCDAYGKALPGHNQGDCYMPQNYDGKFRGPMKLRDALAQSINVPAVKLFYLSGLSDSLRTAEEMGISTLGDVGRYGLTLVIGGGEVSLLDMTSAYGVFANNGVRNPYTGVLKVEDIKGRILEEFRPNEREVLPKNTSLLISDILSDNNARIPTFGMNSPLNIPGKKVAAKTGTTNSNKDAWIIGYTPTIVTGVWAGNNDNTAMKKGGAALAGPIWNKFMTEALSVLPNETFEEPYATASGAELKPILRGLWQGNESFFIDKISGKLATPYTPPEALEEKVITNVHSILYWVDRNDILGPPPADPSSNPQFRLWEASVQNWWAKNKGNYSTTTFSEKPTLVDDIHTSQSKPKISVFEPNSTTFYSPDQTIQLKVSGSGFYPLAKLDVFINDIYMETVFPPFKFSFIPADLQNLRENNELKLVSYDTAFNQSEVIVNFNVK